VRDTINGRANIRRAAFAAGRLVAPSPQRGNFTPSPGQGFHPDPFSFWIAVASAPVGRAALYLLRSPCSSESSLASRSDNPSRTSAVILCLRAVRRASLCSGVSWESPSAILSASLSRSSSAILSLMTMRTMARCSGVSWASRSPRRSRISPDTLSLTIPDDPAPSLSEIRSDSPSRTSAASLCLSALRRASRCVGVSWESRSAILFPTLSCSSSLTTSRMMARCSGVSVTAPSPSRGDCADATPIERARAIAVEPSINVFIRLSPSCLSRGSMPTTRGATDPAE
jgi:hypothetical protein